MFQVLYAALICIITLKHEQLYNKGNIICSIKKDNYPVHSVITGKQWSWFPNWMFGFYGAWVS